MSLSDPIADMLTRVRNAARIGARQVKVRNSKICAGIAGVLREEGYITGFDVIDDGRQGILRIDLKFGPEGRSVITSVDRFSRPGRRVYRGVADLPHVMNGLGIAIVSTSQGILSDLRCREYNIGGEVLCTVG